MKKLLLPLVLIMLFFSSLDLYAQRILVNQNFESTGTTPPDSLPPGWLKEDVDNSGQPFVVWAVRDTGTTYIGANPVVVKAQAHNSRRALTIAWTAGDPVADDWVFTDSLRIMAGDSLIFWMLHGSTEGIQPYFDTMQVHATFIQNSGTSIKKLATIRSEDSNNVWKEYKFDLTEFAGQVIYIAFRYYMNTTVNGLWCNIDDIFIGNRASVGINTIGTGIPSQYKLHQNYPNPFNPKTKIKFDLAKNSNVKLVIFNALGETVRTLFNGHKSAGYYEADFDASVLPSGTYFYKLVTDDYVETKKMILVK